MDLPMLYAVGHAQLDIFVPQSAAELSSHAIDPERSQDFLAENKSLFAETLASGERRLGGSTACVAAVFAALGGKSAFYGTIGSDEDGLCFVKRLKEYGAEFCGMKAHGETGKCLVFLTREQERAFLRFPGVSRDVVPAQIALPKDCPKLVLYFSFYMLQNDEHISNWLSLIQAAKGSGHVVALDTGDLGIAQRVLERYPHICSDCDLLFTNESAAHLLGIDLLQEALPETFSQKTVVIKMGERGSMVWANGTCIRQAAEVVSRCVSTCCAGDHYNAAFVFALFSYGSASVASRFASKLAGCSLAVPGLLSPAEIGDVRRAFFAEKV